MALAIVCPCGQKLQTADDSAGKLVRCPTCKRVLAVTPRPAVAPTAQRHIPWAWLWAAAAFLVIATASATIFWPRDQRPENDASTPGSERADAANPHSGVDIPGSKHTVTPTREPAPTAPKTPPPKMPQPESPRADQADPEPEPAEKTDPRPKEVEEAAPEQEPAKKPEPPPVKKPEPAPAPKPPPEPEKKRARPAGVVMYPVDSQKDVPLTFAGNESPNPIPDSKIQNVGYPLTVVFPPGVRVKNVSATLTDPSDKPVDIWLSTPDKPANPRAASQQRNTICLMAKLPLRFNTTYQVSLTAEVGGRPWKYAYRFTTTDGGKPGDPIESRALAALNAYRKRTGLEPVTLDAALSRPCSAHAHYLVQNLDHHFVPGFDFKDEDPDLPGHSKEGRDIAKSILYHFVDPVAAMDHWMTSFMVRGLLLAPELKSVGLGFAHDGGGNWMSVIEVFRGRRGNRGGAVVIYPVDKQKDVPAARLGDEQNNFVPPQKTMPAGYPITAAFPPGVSVRDVTATLTDSAGKNVDVWLTMPEKPAVRPPPPNHICLVSRAALRPGTGYTVEIKAKVNGKPWTRTWSYTTAAEEDLDQTAVAAKVLAQLNACRRTAGLEPATRVDAALSAGCLAHARYLARNAEEASLKAHGPHDEDPKLPGYSAAGRKAARASVINTSAPPGAVDNWMATLYHRHSLLDPRVKAIGFGFAKDGHGGWISVLDARSGKGEK
jgi:uncharacterized protein YkwD